MPIEPQELMRAAIAAAERGIRSGQSPFGCAIACGDEIVAECHNVVWLTTDITAHAEVTAIRVACRQLNRILLSDCVVATTCEPCPMCASALHWSRVSTVYYGATIADAVEAGFNELKVAANDLYRMGGSPVALQPNILRNECRELFSLWNSLAGEAY